MIKEKIYDLLHHSDFKSLSINFINYGIYQVLTYLIPLFTIPYIIRIIGIEKFGIISLAQAVCYYLTIISDYGYNISGVQYIAQNQNNPGKSSEVVSTVFTIQFSLMLLCLLLLLAVLKVITALRIYHDVFLYSFLIVPANILLAQWFYVGMEKIKFINYITFVSRVLYLLLILLFVQNESDYKIVPLLNSLSMLVAGFYSLFLIIKKFKITPLKKYMLKILSYLRNDFAVFNSVVFLNLYRNSNIIILGFFASESSLGLYSAGEKIIKVIQSTFTPITQVIYPYISRIKKMSKEKGLRIIKYLLFCMATLSGLVSIVLIIFADQISLIAFGKEFVKSGLVIKICAIVILLGTINYILGVIFMTNYSLKKEFAKSVTLTGIINIGICVFLSIYLFEIGAAISFSLAELLLVNLLLYHIIKNKNKWIDFKIDKIRNYQ